MPPFGRLVNGFSCPSTNERLGRIQLTPSEKPIHFGKVAE